MSAGPTRPVDAAFAKVIDCARALAAGADEFYPDYPEALVERVQALDDALERYGRMAAGDPLAPRTRPQVWLLPRYADGKWSYDGAHDPDSDLSSTYAIYRRAFPQIVQYLKLTLKPDKHGTMWPTVEDVTDPVKGCTTPLPDGGVLADMVAGRITADDAVVHFKGLALEVP